MAAVFDAASVYADDTTAWFAAESWEELAVCVESQAACFVEAAARIGLKVNGDKTQLLVHGSVPADFCVTIDGAKIEPSKRISVLGMAVDANLSFNRDALCAT